MLYPPNTLPDEAFGENEIVYHDCTVNVFYVPWGEQMIAYDCSELDSFVFNIYVYGNYEMNEVSVYKPCGVCVKEFEDGRKDFSWFRE